MDEIKLGVWGATGNKRQLVEAPACGQPLRAYSLTPTAEEHSAMSHLIPIDGPDNGDLSRNRRQCRGGHRTMLIVSVAILTASLLLQLRTTGEVALTWLPETSLPPLCVSRTMLGVECPGCGLTRSFVALSSGDFVESFRLHRVGWLIYVSVVLQIPYRTYKLHKLRQTEAAWQAIDQETWLVWFGRFLIAALIVNWLLRMSGV